MGRAPGGRAGLGPAGFRADGTRSATQVEFASGSGTLVSNWHTGASSKQTTLRWADGREVWLDHTAMTCVAMEGGTAVAHLGNEATLDRKDAHYQAMYRAYFDDVDHVLLSPGFARVVAHLLRQAHHPRPGDRPLQWDTM